MAGEPRDVISRLERTLARHLIYLDLEVKRRGNGDVLQPGREKVITGNVVMLEAKLAEFG